MFAACLAENISLGLVAFVVGFEGFHCLSLSLPSLFPQALSKDQPLFKTASRSLALAVVRPRIFTFTAPPIPFKVEFNHFSVADQQSLYRFLRGSYVVAFMRIRPYVPQLASFSIGAILRERTPANARPHAPPAEKLHPRDQRLAVFVFSLQTNAV